MKIFWQLLLQLVLIGLNAFFACAEIAVLSVNEARLAQLPRAVLRRGHRHADSRLHALPHHRGHHQRSAPGRDAD